MPRPKPPGWPAYMVAKRLKSGVRYYWNLPKWAVTAGCTMEREPLGLDYGEAKRRCDEILNPQFQAWLKRGRDQRNVTAPDSRHFRLAGRTVQNFPSVPKPAFEDAEKL